MSEQTNENDKQAPANGDKAAPENGAPPPEGAEILADAVATDAADAPEAANDTADADPQAARIAELEAELAEQKEHALRAMAEAENVRKRAEKQVHDSSRYGTSSFARDMLVVADNLERALAAVPAGEEGAELLTNLREGVEMTLRDLQGKLEAHSVKKVEPTLGDKFDHNQHQAMFEQETTGISRRHHRPDGSARLRPARPAAARRHGWRCESAC